MLTPPASALLCCALLVDVAAGQRQFAPLAGGHLPHESETQILLAADLDGDGDPDLLAIDLADRLRCWRNDGHARFVDVTADAFAGQSTGYVAFAFDIDHDGDLDLAQPQLRAWLFNDGTGRFAAGPPTAFPPSGGVRAADLSDIDGDGRADILVSDYASLRVWLQDAGGRFADHTAALFPTAQPPCRRVDIVDLDRDGRVELLALRSTGPAIYVRTAGGTYVDEGAARLPPLTDAVTNMAVGDLDGDGAAEIVLTGYDVADILLRNDGQGHFVRAVEPGWPTTSRHCYGVQIADLDHDGAPDLLFEDGEGLRLWRGAGQANFVDASDRLPPDLACSDTLDNVLLGVIADLDGDGDPDLGVRGAFSQILLQDHNHHFVAVDHWTLPRFRAESSGFATLDSDRDGDPDLFLAAHARGLRALVNDGTGIFRDATDVLLPPGIGGASEVTALDADGDGNPDLAVFGDSDSVLLGRPDGTFVVGPALPTLSVPRHGARVLDLDHDRDPDLIVISSGGLRALVNDGRGQFTDATTHWLPETPAYVARVLAFDADGDHRVDLMVSGSEPRLLLGTHAGPFVDRSGSNLPPDCRAVFHVAIDIDGDRDADLLGFDDQGLVILRNDHHGRFTQERVAAAPYPGQDIAAADFDEDGDVDLYLVHRISPDGFLVNDGHGDFEDATALRVEEPLPFAAQHDVLPLDIDRDGDLDLVFAVGDVRYEHNFVFVNSHRQLLAPFAAQAGADYELVVSSRPGYATRDAWAVGAIALGRDRGIETPFGVWQLDPRSTAPLFVTRIGAPSGRSVVRIAIPHLPALLDREFAVQAILFEPRAGWHVTGAVDAHIL